MRRYLFHRLVGLLPTLLGASLLVFALVRVLPGDAAEALLDGRGTQQTLQRLQQELQLNRPVWVNLARGREEGLSGLFDSQLGHYYGGLLRGDLGRSILTRLPVASGFLQRFPATVELALASIALALLVGIPAGILAALQRGRAVDTLVMLAAVSGVSMPTFWIAILLMYLFAVVLGWLPPGGRFPVEIDLPRVTGLLLVDSALARNGEAAWATLRHLFLPALALASSPTAILARMTRAAMLEVLASDYVRTARSKGLPLRQVVLRHALRNALLPVVTVIGLSFGGLLTGTILTETVFSWPGVGRWVYDAIGARDYPVVQGGILLFAVIVTLVNLAVDVLYSSIDPRVVYS
jgi:peptide/nickel transport system permease protein